MKQLQKNTGGVRRIFRTCPKIKMRKIERELSQEKARVQKTLCVGST